MCKRHLFHAALAALSRLRTFVEKKPPKESTLLTGSRLPKIFPRRIIRGTSSLALGPPMLLRSPLPLPPLALVLSRVRSELVVEAWNSSVNGAIRINHSALERLRNARMIRLSGTMFACPSKKRLLKIRRDRARMSFVRDGFVINDEYDCPEISR